VVGKLGVVVVTMEKEVQQVSGAAVMMMVMMTSCWYF
jgi:hypothetical protein